jgi:hypothetical protein
MSDTLREKLQDVHKGLESLNDTAIVSRTSGAEDNLDVAEALSSARHLTFRLVARRGSRLRLISLTDLQPRTQTFLSFWTAAAARLLSDRTLSQSFIRCL